MNQKKDRSLLTLIKEKPFIMLIMLIGLAILTVLILNLLPGRSSSDKNKAMRKAIVTRKAQPQITIKYHVNLTNISSIKKNGLKWDAPDNSCFDRRGLIVDLNGFLKKKNIELSLDSNDDYEVRYYNELDEVGRQIITNKIELHLSGLYVHKVPVPISAYDKTFNRIKIYPYKGDDCYSVGHVRFYE